MLNIRFDYSVNVFPFFLRLVYLSLLIGNYYQKSISYKNFFFSGFILGIAVYDKFSSVILIIPGIILCLNFLRLKKIELKHIFLNIAGFAAGSFPLIIINLIYFIKDTKFFTGVIRNDSFYTFSDFVHWFAVYPGLGAGNYFLEYMLGEKSPNFYYFNELFFISLFTVVILFLNSFVIPRKKIFNLSTIFFLCWIMTFFVLYLSPQKAYERNYLLGTPFQYLAIIFIFPLLKTVVKINFRNLLKLFLIILFSFWFIVRGINLFRVASFLTEGKYSNSWDPSFTKIGLYARNKSEDSLFVSLNWGTGIQIFLLNNGSEDNIFEPFTYTDFKGITDIYRELENKNKKYLYTIVNKYSDNNDTYFTRNKIINDINNSDLFAPLPLEEEFENLTALDIRKYSYKKI